MTCTVSFLNNVVVEVTRRGETSVSGRNTLQAGGWSQVGELTGAMEETTEEERQAYAGEDGVPTMRFVCYQSWLLRPKDRLRVSNVLFKWRQRYGHLSGTQYTIVSTANSCRGMIAYLGPVQSETA